MHSHHFDPWQLTHRLRNPQRSSTSRVPASRPWIPAVDIKEQAEKFVIRADVPGVEPENIDITMEKGVLSIRGTREVRNGDEIDIYRHAERASGAFERRFSLPRAADTDAVSADYRSGVLTVTIPKQASALARRIEIGLN